MPQILPQPTSPESRAARRLARLFRIERSGGFERCPAEAVGRLVERRDAMIRELLRLDPAHALAPRAELEDALRELAAEVDSSLSSAEARVTDLGTELRLRRPDKLTGMRSSAGGRLLGRG